MITSTIARKPFTNLNLLPKSKTFAKRGLVIFHNYKNTPNFALEKIKLSHKNKHKFHTLSYVLITRHLKCHTLHEGEENTTNHTVTSEVSSSKIMWSNSDMTSRTA